MNINYQYNGASVLHKEDKTSTLFLSQYNEAYVEKKIPFFFSGKLNEPYFTARTLLSLSKVVGSNFMPMGASLRDPVITAGAKKLRLEGFSSCCSVYAKVTLLPKAIDGEFMQQGTTNVDFNAHMISALSQVKANETLSFSVGEKEFVLKNTKDEVVEKKVSLPLKWIKGMATVQLLASEMDLVLVLDKLQIQLLFRAIPKGSVTDTVFYLTLRGRRPFLSPVKSKNAIAIRGIQRLRLAEGLVSLADRLTIYTTKEENATAFKFHLSHVRFTIMLSQSFWRGFSGEGNNLEHLVEEIPNDWLEKLERYAQKKEEFSVEDILLKEIPSNEFKSVATRLSSMGLLGFDLEDKVYYYRKLPFKLSRIERLNPRYKNALELIGKQKYEWIDKSENHLETHIKGSGVRHKVVITPKEARCTCTWFATHGISRGLCKHILATKILKENPEKELTNLLKEFGFKMEYK